MLASSAGSVWCASVVACQSAHSSEARPKTKGSGSEEGGAEEDDSEPVDAGADVTDADAEAAWAEPGGRVGFTGVLIAPPPLALAFPPLIAAAAC